MTRKICILGKKSDEYGQYKVKPLAFQKKICISPNSRVKKSVYTDKICMSGRSVLSPYVYSWQEGYTIFKKCTTKSLRYSKKNSRDCPNTFHCKGSLMLQFSTLILNLHNVLGSMHFFFQIVCASGY